MRRDLASEVLLRAPPMSTLPPARVPVSLHCVGATIREVRKYGVTSEALLQGSGIREEQLLDPWAPINRAQELVVFKNACGLTQDPSIGLLIGTAMHLPSYGPLGYALMVSPNLRTALECALQCPLLLGSYFQIILSREGPFAVISFNGYRYDAELARMSSDLCLTSMWIMIGDAFGSRRPPMSVSLREERPPNWRLYEQVFGCEAEFGSDCDALRFPLDWLDSPLQFSEPISHRMAVEQCHRIERQWGLLAGDPIVYKILQSMRRDVVRCSSVEAVAAELCMSERTLRRQLQAAGTSFQTLLDQTRQELALEYLASTNLQVAQIADLLGYSEPSSFRAAFRRWTGRTPADCRPHANSWNGSGD